LYLGAIAVVSVLAGLALDLVYGFLNINASAVVGQAGDIFPGWVQLAATAVLIAISVGPIWRKAVSWAGSLGIGGKGPACPSCEHS
ncbi:MAG: permease, partial [bacterium]